MKLAILGVMIAIVIIVTGLVRSDKIGTFCAGLLVGAMLCYMHYLDAAGWLD